VGLARKLGVTEEDLMDPGTILPEASSSFTTLFGSHAAMQVG